MKVQQVISYVGVDIAKDKIDICVYDGNSSNHVYHSYSNENNDFDNFLLLLSSINDLENIRIGFEATSTYMVNLQIFLDEHNIKYLLINPLRLSHFIKYKHKTSKTDKLDSYFIADYVSLLKDESFNSSHSKTKLMYKSYLSYLNLVTKIETHIKGIKDSVASDDFASETLQTEILNLNDFLKRTRKKIEKELMITIRIAMPEYDFIKNDLVGVGDKTLVSVLPLIYDISEDFNIKQLQSFMGLDIVYVESGSSVNKKQRISKKGNSLARKNLYMAAVSSIKPVTGNAFLIGKYQRLISKGKPSKVALVAIECHIFRAIVTKLNYYKNLKKG